MRCYVVRQGDYLSRLACAYGFDANAVWNDPANRELRGRRPNPEVLLPGDVLRIPEAPDAGLSVSSGSTHRYRAHVPTTRVTIRLHEEAKPKAGEAFVIEGAGPERIVGTTGDSGVIAFDVPITVSECLLRLPKRGVAYPLLVGHLDPHNEPSGVAARLEHLGFLAPDLRTTLERGLLGAGAYRPTVPEPPADALVEAIKSFQRYAGIQPTGVANEETMEALRRAHDGDESS
jgi:hypothetical protein